MDGRKRERIERLDRRFDRLLDVLYQISIGIVITSSLAAFAYYFLTTLAKEGWK